MVKLHLPSVSMFLFSIFTDGLVGGKGPVKDTSGIWTGLKYSGGAWSWEDGTDYNDSIWQGSVPSCSSSPCCVYIAENDSQLHLSNCGSTKFWWICDDPQCNNTYFTP